MFSSGQVPVTLTAYWPYVPGLSPAELAMEGGTKDRKGRRLNTLEEHQGDPNTYPYVSCAGDYTLWKDGQRITLNDVDPAAIFRVVDTGGHFHGAGKVVRNPGCEPVDICVQTAGDNIGPRVSTAILVEGDTFEGPLGGPPIPDTSDEDFMTLFGLTADVPDTDDSGEAQSNSLDTGASTALILGGLALVAAFFLLK